MTLKIRQPQEELNWKELKKHKSMEKNEIY